MKTRILLAAILTLVGLVLTPATFAQQPERPLTNVDVVRLVKDGVPQSVILESIRSRPGTFDLSNKSRAALFAAGGKSRVKEMTQIWDAMMAKATNGRGGDEEEEPNPPNPQPNPPKGKTNAPSAAGGSGGQANPKVTPAAGAPKIAEQVKNPRAVQANAGVIAVLQQQRQVADSESAQMKLGIRPQNQASLPGGSSAVNGGSARSTTSAPATTVLRSPSAGTIGTEKTADATGNSLASRTATMTFVDATAVICAHDPTFRILNVSGSSFPATFTPIDQYNLYTITGCSFGGQSGKAYLYGAGTFQANFIVKFWSENSIALSLDPALSGYPDLNNLSLVIKRADGQEVQKPGFKFYAARQSVLLNAIPQSWVKLADFPFGFNTEYSSPTESGSSHVQRFANGHKNAFLAGVHDYYDFSRLLAGWTTDSLQLTTYDQNCPLVVTYRQNFGTWYANWDGDNIRVWLSDTTCSGFNPAFPLQNYQNWTGSYYSLKVWISGPRGTDPWTGKPASQ